MSYKYYAACFLVLIITCSLTGRNWRSLQGPGMTDTAPADTNKLFEIGKTVPDIRFSLENSTISNGKLSDYKGKLIILDFWNTFCATCIKLMPEMEELQRNYSAKLQVILVTADSKARVDNLRKRNKILAAVRLPMIIADSVFSSRLPSVTFPTHVWLDSNRRVLQITNGYNTNDSSVSGYLRGQEINLPEKNEYRDFDKSVPLWQEGNGRQLKYFQYYSLITSAINYRVHSGMSQTDSLTNIVIWSHLFNYTIYELYEEAFKSKYGSDFYFEKRCIVLSTRKDKMMHPKNAGLDDTWMKTNGWCYELRLPPEKGPRLWQFMVQDLDRFFDLHTTIIKKKVKCLVLVWTKEHRYVSTPKNVATDAEKENFNDTKHKPVRIPVSVYLQGIHQDRLVIDETGGATNADKSLLKKTSHPDIIAVELRKNGLELIEKTKTIDMILIRDR